MKEYTVRHSVYSPWRTPLTVYFQEMSFSLCRLRFVELYRQVVDNMQAPTGYTFITEMDGKLSKSLEEVPNYFQASSAPHRGVKGLELTLCMIMGETRRLRLHRPFLFRGYKDRRYVTNLLIFSLNLALIDLVVKIPAAVCWLCQGYIRTLEIG